MNSTEMKDTIKAVMRSENPYGIKIYAYLDDEENKTIKKFLANDALTEEVKKMINPIIDTRFLLEEIELDSSDNISDNRRVLYEINQTDNYSPFSFLSDANNIADNYSEKDQDSLAGLFFRINLNDDVIWLYQHIYHVRLIKRSKSIYAVLSPGDKYIPLDRDIFNIDSRIDLAIINGSIITSNISLLQQSFGFEKYIRSEAAKTIQTIETLDILSDTSKLLAFEDKAKLTNAKKLLKAQKSPVLDMDKTALISGLQKHPRYKNKFKFEKGKIIINSQKDVAELIKMLNDDIVRSELTNQEYDSTAKNRLEPLS